MLYRTDELLLLEIMTYFPDNPPFRTILNAGGSTVGQYVNSFDWASIEDEKDYACLMNGLDWKNVILAVQKNPSLMKARIAEAHLDTAYGGGGGISAVFLNDQSGEAVVAFRGTAANEWLDDFLGANQIDSLQQINALEWYKAAYERLELEHYEVTVIGHSKGGAKAKYVTVLNDTPKRCFSFDGQGFSDEFIRYYSGRIRKRQDIIENHNIDFDYVNILMNDIGKSTYYVGFDYGKHGFMETHSPITFFSFGENGEYTLRVNPNGQRPEMQLLDQFFNSLIRSGISQKEKQETNRMIGIVVEKYFGIGKEHSSADFLNLLCDLIGDPQYSDNAAYLIAFCIRYFREKPEFLQALRDIMHSFHADDSVRVIDMVADLVTSRKINAILTLTDFLIHHVNGIVVKQVRGFCSKKYDLLLSDNQARGLLQVVCMTRDTMKTLRIHTDGSDLEITDEIEDASPLALPEDLNVVVLAGGLSNERNLSLRSGSVVSKLLSERGYRVILLDSFMGYGSREQIISDAFSDPVKYSLAPGEISDEIPDLWAVRKRRQDHSDAYFGPNVLQICRQADLVFIALHGAAGENGKVQATFDLLGIDYTGCDYFSSALSSNKSVSKQLLAEAGIPVPKGYLVYRDREKADPESRSLNYPVIVKPNNGGIGLGISVAGDPGSYHQALKKAFRWENEILVEEYVSGREFAVGILDGKALPVLEKLPLETRDKEVGKSLRGNAVRKCPADIPEELSSSLMRAAEEVSAVLGVTACSKVDFIVREDGSYVCLECDSLPQLYQDAHLVLEAEAAGISFGDLCDRIMEMSLRKG